MAYRLPEIGAIIRHITNSLRLNLEQDRPLFTILSTGMWRAGLGGARMQNGGSALKADPPFSMEAQGIEPWSE